MNGQQWNEERNRIRERLIGLVDRELPPTTRPEAWTGEDVLLHVLLSNLNIIKLLERLLEKANPEDHDAPDKRWPVREDLESLVDERSFAVDAFPGTDPNIDITESEKDRLVQREGAITELAETADRYRCESIVFPHPLVGRMNVYEWLAFALFHERAHIRKLENDLGL